MPPRTSHPATLRAIVHHCSTLPPLCRLRVQTSRSCRAGRARAWRLWTSAASSRRQARGVNLLGHIVRPGACRQVQLQLQVFPIAYRCLASHRTSHVPFLPPTLCTAAQGEAGLCLLPHVRQPSNSSQAQHILSHPLPLLQLKEKHAGISYRDVMSAAMYPKVFEEYK